jgi:hypothetical protein
MTDITVDCAASPNGWSCNVTVTDWGGNRKFEVTVKAADLARLAPGAADPSALVRRSFEFLLDREPKESILHSFDLNEISRYFPEFERVIRR